MSESQRDVQRSVLLGNALLIGALGLFGAGAGWLLYRLDHPLKPVGYDQAYQRAEAVAGHAWRLTLSESRPGCVWLWFHGAGCDDQWDVGWPDSHVDFKLLSEARRGSTIWFSVTSKQQRTLPASDWLWLQGLFWSRQDSVEPVDCLTVVDIDRPIAGVRR